ncbi:nucleoside hydrolase [Planctomycetes bacterium K23_9]|uniref:Pyrimidine-specific ribonucleoside hydrolase RihA n=1 Tax=Stieleria marina TaxID=1930275 RepID=A0A517NSA5_9BACT|nr:Pyrimidine-specific ribonucleoside hydrolase RihA [Planctomycetes bacterium K23_9]
MARKIIIDCDPGIDDAIAICMALFDPRLEVLAITGTAGTIPADQATSNVNAIVDQLDPPKHPRIGKATVLEDAPVSSDLHLNGDDGLGGCGINGSIRQHSLPSEKVISELLRNHPDQVTLLCLGPLTNLARLCQHHAAVVPMIDKVVISGGALQHPGNASPVAESNMFFDPIAAMEVFASATTKSLVPLDVVEKLTFGVDLLEQLPPKHTRAGDLLHRLLPFAFRAAHQHLGRELIPLQDAVALLAVLEPDLFSWEMMAGRVETSGELTRGATVFDRRLRPEWAVNMEVAVDVADGDAKAMLIRSLRYAGQQS